MPFEKLGEKYQLMPAAVTIDSVDAARLASWWADLLGVEKRPLDPGETYVVLPPQDTGFLQLGFQQVPESKQVKNRIHVDFVVKDLDAAQAMIEEKGGELVAEHTFGDRWRWRIMTDPEGNEFCIVHTEG
jgi:predicted enzyme related to lactoylglutathione lyase